MDRMPLYDNKSIFKFRIGDKATMLDGGGCAFIDGKWKDITPDSLFKDKKIIMFGLPGAFTPTCSSQQLPAYEGYYDEFKDLGIDAVYCISVNDAFVMNAWSRALRIEKVELLPDGSGGFTKSLGMLVNKPAQGFGMRSWRYSAYVDDREIVKFFEEPGLNELSTDEDPYDVSNPETMLDYLKSYYGFTGDK